jgi:copper(I)-binding protein
VNSLRTTLRLAGFASAALLVVTACGGDDSSSSTEAPAAEITVEGAWARQSPMGVDVGAMYMTLTSPVDDALVAASVPAEVATTVEIHETVMSGEMSDDTMMSGDTMMSEDTMMSDTTMAGEMSMRPIESLALPAGEAVEMKPGGYHIMLLGLPTPLEVGQEIVATLTFESGATLEVTVPVLAEAP